jgi:hypothetical protein
MKPMRGIGFKIEAAFRYRRGLNPLNAAMSPVVRLGKARSEHNESA